MYRTVITTNLLLIASLFFPGRGHAEANFNGGNCNQLDMELEVAEAEAVLGELAKRVPTEDGGLRESLSKLAPAIAKRAYMKKLDDGKIDGKEVVELAVEAAYGSGTPEALRNKIGWGVRGVWGVVGATALISATSGVLYKVYEEPLAGIVQHAQNWTNSTYTVAAAAAIAASAATYGFTKLLTPYRGKIDAVGTQAAFLARVAPELYKYRSRFPEYKYSIDAFYSGYQFGGTFRERGSEPQLTSVFTTAAEMLAMPPEKVTRETYFDAARIISLESVKFVRWFVDQLVEMTVETAPNFVESTRVLKGQAAAAFLSTFRRESQRFAPDSAQVKVLLAHSIKATRDVMRNYNMQKEFPTLELFAQRVLVDIMTNPQQWEPWRGGDYSLFSDAEGKRYVEIQKSLIEATEVEAMLSEESESVEAGGSERRRRRRGIRELRRLRIGRQRLLRPLESLYKI